MNRLLPMQDYPQHLFLSHVIATYENPAYNWKEFYTVDLKLSPYMLWYLAMKPLSLLYGVEVAGKMLFSLYILLISLLVHRTRRLCPKGAFPWGALLLFPFAFNQVYFMGFANYIVLLPVLMLAVMDLEELALKGLSWWRVVLHATFLTTLYLGHPYTVLVYICLAVTTALCFWDNRSTMLKVLLPSVLLGGGFLHWYLVCHNASPVSNSYSWRVNWLSVNNLIHYYIPMFTGMRLTNGPDWSALVAWIVIATTCLYAWQHTQNRYSMFKLPIFLFFASIAGYFVLPFRYGYYSYFNLRLAPVSYFLMVLLLARLLMAPIARILVAVATVTLVVLIIISQSRVSRSSEAVLPLLGVMEKNSLVLPLIFDSASTVIDPACFDEFHMHELNYYHVLIGGGANPTLFPNAMMPVQYRPGIYLPYPEKPYDFRWEEHGQYYTYFLLRGAPAEFSRRLKMHTKLVATSGPWSLFLNKSPKVVSTHASSNNKRLGYWCNR
jgi:hypothetical protein